MVKGKSWLRAGKRLLSAVIVLSLLVVPVAPVHAQVDVDLEANKELVLRVAEEIYNQQNLDVVEEIFAPGLIVHSTSEEDLVLETIEDIQAYIGDDLDFLPDIFVEVHDLIAEGDRVVATYTLISETSGVSVDGVYIVRIADGKIVEEWNLTDDLSLMTQLGLVEMPSEMMEPMVIAEGFNAPQGILVDDEGTVWVIDSGVGGETELSFPNPETGEMETATFGESARVVMVDAEGMQTDAATLPSLVVGEEAVGGARLALLDGELYATSGGWIGDPAAEVIPMMASIVNIGADGVTEVANMWEIEASENPDGFIYESHPYGLAAGPDGRLWVADAGANDLFAIDLESGDIELIAVFDGVPSPLPNAARGDAMESDPVPTGIAFDTDGNAYVSFLPGFPFLPGSAKVVQVAADGTVSDYATGLTMITDLRAGPDGNFYAVQFGLFTEEGPQMDSGAIVRVHEGEASEIVLDGLSFPTSIDFDADGNAYITVNGVGAPGSGAVVMAPALTGAPDMPAMGDEEMAMEEESTIPEAAMGPEIPQDKGYLVEEILDGVYWVTEGAYQVMFLTTGEGVIVVDAPPTLAPFLLDAIAEVTDEPVTHVIYSHYHADHIGGAGILPPDAVYIAHEETAAQLAYLGADDADREFPFGSFLGGGPVPLPTETFADSYTLEVGDQVLELDYLGSNHADGNLFIFAPDQGVLMLVDVVFPGWEPFYGLALASDVEGFIAAHEEALAYDFDTLVAGHLTRLGTRADVETQLEFILDIRENAVTAMGSVDPMEIGMEVGFSDPWAFFSAYLDAVAQECVALTEETWGGRLGGIGSFTESHCWIMAEHLRVE